MKIYSSVSELVGNTPMLRLSKFARAVSAKGHIFAKLEYLNPAGSIKDRVALGMIEDAERRGLLSPSSVIIEPTSGNTGIGLAAIGVSRGYRVIIVMPDTMSAERIKLMRAYGAEVVLTDGSLGMRGAIEKAEALSEAYPGSYLAGQFSNPANPGSHERTTGPEIVGEMDGNIDVLVASVGTGGTITGVGRYIREHIPSVRIVAVEPSGSPVLSGGKPGKHGIQGIGAGFVPEVLDTSVYDEIITVGDDEAVENMRLLARTEGILAGISSGAALTAAAKLAISGSYDGRNIVVILPDSGDRYLSGDVFP